MQIKNLKDQNSKFQHLESQNDKLESISQQYQSLQEKLRSKENEIRILKKDLLFQKNSIKNQSNLNLPRNFEKNKIQVFENEDFIFQEFEKQKKILKQKIEDLEALIVSLKEENLKMSLEISKLRKIDQEQVTIENAFKGWEQKLTEKDNLIAQLQFRISQIESIK